MNNVAACTIVSRNYFAYAKTLRDSYLLNHPNHSFHILIVDSRDVEFGSETNVTFVEDLQIPGFHSYAMRYDILELNTNVKPTFLLSLLKTYEKVVYLDPDIQVFRPLDIIHDRLDQYSIVLTPHIVRPIADAMKPGEVDFLSSGQFNLGFIAVRRDDNSIAMLNWWQNRCLEEGYNEPARGLFVDQKWVNLVPCLFDGVFIEKAPGCNMAYWNLHERRLTNRDGVWFANDCPLYFFHFSGLVLGDTDSISKYQNRFDLINRSDLVDIFSHYRRLLTDNGHVDYQKYKYGFGRFSDGKLISHVARRLYAISDFRSSGADPFDAKGAFYLFCARKRLFSAPGGAQTYNSYNTDQNDIRLRIVRAGFRLAYSVLGVDRYSQFLKYIGYMCSIRRQQDIFLDRR